MRRDASDEDRDDDGSEDDFCDRLAALKARKPHELTEAEKREKLRLANRESARKMRRRRVEELEHLKQEVGKEEAKKLRLVGTLDEVTRLREATLRENDMLLAEINTLPADPRSSTGGSGQAGTVASTSSPAGASPGHSLSPGGASPPPVSVTAVPSALAPSQSTAIPASASPLAYSHPGSTPQFPTTIPPQLLPLAVALSPHGTQPQQPSNLAGLLAGMLPPPS